ncbi:MAG: virulence RhuM family protein, partial [Mesonia sp.]
MKEKDKNIKPSDELSDFILYTAPSGEVRIEIYLQNETIWLTQQKIAELFGVDRTVVTKHLKNIYREGELEKTATSAKFAQVQKEGEREVKRNIVFYNLDAIISVGYRVNSAKATQFRIW